MDDSDVGTSSGNQAPVQTTEKILIVAFMVLLFAVVFALFLHLYAKLFWWRIEQTSASRPRRRRGQDSSRSKGLDACILQSLPVIEFKPEDFKDGLECTVCLSELEKGEKARLLPKCNHGFHVDCIDMWFQSHTTCPICRDALAVDVENQDDSSSDESFTEEDLPNHHDDQSHHNNSGSEYIIEVPNFPTNVLFWGNQTQVNIRAASSEDDATIFVSSPCSPVTTTTTASRPQDGVLVIDIPTALSENISSSSLNEFVENELKSPLGTRLSSLKRLF